MARPSLLPLSFPLFLLAALFGAALFGAALFGADAVPQANLIRPSDLAADFKTPLVLHTGFAVLYRSVHIPGSVYAGPGSKPEGLEALKKAVEGQPRTRQIVLYCGCCPWDKCPNIRPAFAALKEMGFQHVKAVLIPENLKTDWTDKGYPTERHADQTPK